MKVDPQLRNKLSEMETSLVRHYGQTGQSAVESVSAGIERTSLTPDVVSTNPDLFENLIGGPLIGTMIGEAIGGWGNNDSNEEAGYKNLGRRSDADLAAFSDAVFGKSGVIKALGDVGVYQVQSESANDQALEVAEKQKDLIGKQKKLRFNPEIMKPNGPFTDTEGTQNVQIAPVSEALTALAKMDSTLHKTLQLRDDVLKIKWPIRA